jgi:cytochrome c553
MKIKRHHLAFVLLSISAAVLQAAEPVVPTVAPTKATDGKTIFQTVCAQCHGNNGEGKAELKSPSIASLPSWYVNTQFANFPRRSPRS